MGFGLYGPFRAYTRGKNQVAHGSILHTLPIPTSSPQIYEVQKKANQETSQMKDAKRRLKQRCETDLKHIHDAIQKADLEDAESMKRFAAMKVLLQKET